MHDIRANTIASIEFPLKAGRQASETLRELRDQVHRLASDNGIDLAQVLGLGVGVASGVDDNGVILDHRVLGWRDVPATEILSEGTDYPVAVDRAQRGMATAEAWFGAGVGRNSLAVLLVSDVVGCGLYADGRAIRGADYVEGHVGHIRVPNGTQYCDVCHRLGCLHAEVADQAVAEAALKVIDPSELLAGDTPPTDSTSIVQRLHALARSGHDQAVNIVKGRAMAIGYGLAIVSAILDPQLLLLAGATMLDGWDLMRQDITAGWQTNRPLPFLDRTSEIGLTSFGSNATLVGAASLLLRHFYITGGIAADDARRRSGPLPERVEA